MCYRYDRRKLERAFVFIYGVCDMQESTLRRSGESVWRDNARIDFRSRYLCSVTNTAVNETVDMLEVYSWNAISVILLRKWVRTLVFNSSGGIHGWCCGIILLRLAFIVILIKLETEQ